VDEVRGAVNRLNRRQLLRGAVGIAAGSRALRAGTSVHGLAGNAALLRSRLPARLDAAQADDSVVVLWDRALLEPVRATKPGPPMAARALAVLHTCIYDAWALYQPVAVPTAAPVALRRPAAEGTAAAWTAAVSYAARRALVDLFPAQTAGFDALLSALGYDPANGSTDPTTPAGIGNLAAQAVLDFRHGDGSNQLGDLHPGAYSDYTGYEPVNTPDTIADPNRWQPLRVLDANGNVVVQQYIGPHWGLVTPFALASGDKFRPEQGPATFGTEAYKTQVDKILDYSANLTDRQKVVTEYWADGPGTVQPPGHWAQFGQYVSQRDGHDLDADVPFFFILSNALLDAGIACWDAKRAWDSVRPVTAVHYLYHGQQIRAWAGPYLGTRTILGEDWQSYQLPIVVTPAFPEFFSGHSTFSAAAAEVLARLTGSDAFGASWLVPAGTSLLEPRTVPAEDLLLAWETFSDAADEAGMSRRFGGIHFEQGDLTGRRVGRLVGAAVWDRAQAYLTGSL
jgi:hypothetical protein